jgi:tetratricopeptide (TPR) repeat protein
METLFNTACNNIRLNCNEKLKNDLFSVEMQDSIDAVEAHAGLLHVYLKLLFQLPYQDTVHIVHKISNSLFTLKTIKYYLENYSGQERHPVNMLAEKNAIYETLVDQLLEELHKKTTYVDNISLNNILLLVEQSILELLPDDEKEEYLNHILENSYLPETAKSMTYFERGFLHSKNNLEKCLSDYTRTLELRPNDNMVRLLRANVYSSLGNNQKAIDDYTHIIDQTQNALTRIVELESKDEHLPTLKKLKKMFYLNIATAMSCRGDLFAKEKYYGAAFDDYDQICRLIPNHPDILYKRAFNFESMGKPALAQKDYEAILHIQENNPMAEEGLARCFVEQKQNEKALEIYLNLSKRFETVPGLKLECIKLTENDDQITFAKSDEELIEKWLAPIIKDPSITVDDLLFCSHYAARRGLLAFAQIAYNKVNDRMTTYEQYEKSTDINLLLQDMDAFILNQEKQALLKPSDVLQVKLPRPLIPYENEEYTDQVKKKFDHRLFGKNQLGKEDFSQSSELLTLYQKKSRTIC